MYALEKAPSIRVTARYRLALQDDTPCRALYTAHRCSTLPEALAFIESFLGVCPEEVLVVILLSEDLFPVGYVEAYRGTIRGLTADPRGIFVPALLADVGRIIVVHNHPMGSAEASGEDRLFTRKLVCAGDLLNIRLEDHLIVGTDGVLSLQDLWPDVFLPPLLY